MTPCDPVLPPAPSAEDAPVGLRRAGLASADATKIGAFLEAPET